MNIISEKRKARIIAFEALYQYEFRPDEIDSIKKFKWVNTKISDFVFGLAKKIFLGTLENIEEIDSLIRKFSKNWDIERMNKVDKSILRFSIYQLLYFKQINPCIVIDEAIEISKSFSTPKSFKFINGVLDVICKELGLYHDRKEESEEKQKEDEKKNENNYENEK